MSTLPSTTTADLKTAIAKTKERLNATDNSDFQFLKLEKSGTWIFGADDIEVNDTDVWAIDPNTFMTGYIAWAEEGEPLGEEMASILDTPIDKNSLANVGVKWAEQVGFVLICIEGGNAGVQAVYKTTALGGRKAFRKLLDEVLARAEQDEDALVPLVYLDTDWYKHKKYGKIFTPVFTIEEWLAHAEVAELTASTSENAAVEHDGEEVEAEAEAEPEPEPEAKPKRGRKKSTSAKPEDEKPARTRRTRTRK